MRSRKPVRLGDILGELIDRGSMRDPVERATVIEAWAELAGPEINAVTRSVRFEKGTLEVFLTRSSWRQELHFRRTEWKERVNRKLGRSAVSEIRFR